MSNRKPRIPSYRKHSSGQARVTIQGKDWLLGEYGTAESKEEYNRVVSEYLTGSGRFAPPPPEEQAEPLTVAELVLAYYNHAVAYYGWDAEPRRGDHTCTKDALKVVRLRFGSLYARDFGPKALKACRQDMIEKGWSRAFVNAQVARVRRMFRWGAEEELVSGSVHVNLRTVDGLKKGKTDARETKKVKPVGQEQINKTLPYLSETVAAMVRFQLATGCRPAEVCLLRPDAIDRTNPGCWVFTPEKHKTDHHDKERHILIGPKAQAILEPVLSDCPEGEYVFSPKRADQKRQEQRRAERKTPLWKSHVKHQRKKRVAKRKRPPSEKYTTVSYRQAIHRACDNAKIKRWGPNRLRHARATELRRQAGLDVAKTVLGHSKVETTQVYAEKDLAAAMAVVAKHG